MTKFKFILILFFTLSISLSFAQKKKKNKKNKKSPKSEQVAVSTDNKIKAERLFFDGQQEKLIGNVDKAYNNFSQSIKYNPNLDASYYEIAQLQQYGGDYVSAQKSIEKALAISSDNKWYQQYYADILASQYKYSDAASVLHELSNNNPDDIEYQYQEAYYLLLSEEYKGSINIYNSIEEKVGVQPDASLQKYKIQSRLNNNDEAVKELEKLINAYPDELEFQHKLAEFYLINMQGAKAVPILEQILEIDPYNIQALTSLADYYKSEGNHEKAFEYSKKAFENDEVPIDVKIRVLYNYIEFYDKNKESINEAFELSDILMKTHPKEAKAFAIAADLRNVDNQAEKALPLYLKSLELQKDVFSVWQQVFFIQSDLKKFEDLVQVSNDAKNYFPNQAIVYYFNGIAYNETKDTENAIKAYERGLKMSGENKLLKAQFYSNLGDIYNTEKKYVKSDENFDKALEIDPENALVLNNYSYYLSLREEKLDKATEMIALANKLVPNNPSYLDTYAWVLFKNKEYEEAKKWQEKAINIVKDPSATLLEHMGDILFKLNQKEDALNYWKKAADKDNSNDLLNKKIANKQLYE